MVPSNGVLQCLCELGWADRCFGTTTILNTERINTMTPFERFSHESDKTDNCGKVRITVSLVAGSKAVKGNIIRTLSIQNSQVTKVFEAIQEVLFKE